MREIVFRGKRIKDGAWDRGHLTLYADYGAQIRPLTYMVEHPVIPETVGQYTGLKDSNGVRIFEGDIARKHDNREIVLVRWDDESCGFVYDCTLSKHTPRENSMSLSLFHFRSEDYEIIGNIHDNVELLDRE
jgi:uncharacterized phage protein (TIGR01671 family)